MACERNASVQRPAVVAELEGNWRATLALPGGELPFGLIFARDGERWNAEIVNGDDRIRVTEIELSGNALTVQMPGYENRLSATLAGEAMQGELTMLKPGGKEQVIAFAARRGAMYRFVNPAAPSDAASVGAPADVSGRWAVTFDGNGQPSPAIGEFRQRGNEVVGTFLTPTGDHRYLAGDVVGNTLKLAKFDGGHVFLYEAQLAPDGTMQGQFWSGTGYNETFSARRDAKAELASAYDTTKMREGQQRLNFSFPDLDGKPVSSRDRRFAGKVLVVALAGSWCPNCHDEAAFLAPLYAEYREQGLEIVSLMFEQFGDMPRAVEATERFRARYGIEYTTLIAGTSDKQDAALRMPELTGVFAFPTTIFIDRRGTVRRIHSGFAGPATGEHYEKLKSGFTALITELLNETA